MARYDNAWLLARVKKELRRPPTDELLADTDIYDLLSEAQEDWLSTISAVVPHVNYGPPTLMVSTDNGVTYYFGTDPVTGTAQALTPIGSVEVYSRLATGLPLLPGSYWDTQADYVHEGDHIRFPLNRVRTFTNGPYARFISPPAPISASVQPVLKPTFARPLLVYRACAKACEGILKEDPTPFYDLETRTWTGDMDRGMPGILGALRQQFNDQGNEAQGSGGRWYDSSDLGGPGAS